jgi:hypothetical protein
LRAVPNSVLASLALALAAQIAWQAKRPLAPVDGETLGAPPRAETLRLVTFGEPAAAARLAMLHVQGYELRGLDYGNLAGWLHTALELDPRSAYPLFAAARIFAETPDEANSRRMLAFIHAEFLRDPDHRWPWLAHAALLAKHRLKDLPLAREYAGAVARHAKSMDVPLWARQMEVFILEDMNELEAAKIMLGGLLESGTLHDPGELRFLRQRLKELEARLGAR